MFAYFNGKIVKKDKEKVVIDVGNIGYEIYMPQGDVDRLELDKICKIHTYTDIKEGSFQIFGFIDEEEQSVFEKLKKVSGIGSKTALNILSYMSPMEVCVAIANEDTVILSKIPGLGAKTAARIVLELKDKILKEAPDIVKKPQACKMKTNTAVNEAVLALKVLGYSGYQIEETISRIDTENKSVEQIIKLVLANIK
ncbi:MAG: Holliday junction branch migration protein RuvA [Clostridia bacterium]|nr:Holliday junction branch migration protein RuvA [Clostridia bacterium]